MFGFPVTDLNLPHWMGWLANSTFKSTQINSAFVRENTLRIDNRTVVPRTIAVSPIDLLKY